MRVVGIHGIGQTFLGAAQLQPEWLAALNAGLDEVGGPRLVDGDFTMVGYGPLFRPEGTRNAGPRALDPDDVDLDELDADEQTLLVAWWEEAARLSGSSARTLFVCAAAAALLAIPYFGIWPLAAVGLGWHMSSRRNLGR